MDKRTAGMSLEGSRTRRRASPRLVGRIYRPCLVKDEVIVGNKVAFGTAFEGHSTSV